MLVRRRIQTPSVAKVRSAVQREGEVVLGASPPTRRINSVFFLFANFLPLPTGTRGGGRSGLRRPHGLSPSGLYVSSPRDGDDATRRSGELRLGAWPISHPRFMAWDLVPGHGLLAVVARGEDDELAACLSRGAFWGGLWAEAD